MLLTDEQIHAELLTLEGWRREGIFLKKDFFFSNFKEINKFLPYLTSVIVSSNHHPDFSFDSGKKRVALQVTTHSEKGITKSDINLARTLENYNRVV